MDQHKEGRLEMEEKNEVLSVGEVMKRLKLSYQTVLALIAAGTLPATKFGSKFRIQSKDLYAMLDANKRPASEDKEGGP